MDIASRLKTLADLDSFCSEKRKFFSNVLNMLHWTEESVDGGEAKVQCPINIGHWVPESSLKEHSEKCAFTSGGYLKDEKDKQPPSSQFFYKNSTSVVPVIIDKEVQASIISEGSTDASFKKETVPEIPLTIDRTTVELTPQQRLSIYDYVVNSGKALSKSNNVKMEDLLFDFEKKNGDEKPKSELELLAEERDYKRRRQSYRAKNVHITKKSYTEVMKEVIENQITYLAESRKQEEEIDRIEYKDSLVEDVMESKERKDGSNSETSRHRSHRHRSRSQERSHRKRKKSRSRSSSRPRHKHKKSHHKKKHKKKSH